MITSNKNTFVWIIYRSICLWTIVGHFFATHSVFSLSLVRSAHLFCQRCHLKRLHITSNSIFVPITLYSTARSKTRTDCKNDSTDFPCIILLPLFPRNRQLWPRVHLQVVRIQSVVIASVGPLHLIERRVKRQTGGHPNEHIGAQTVTGRPIVEFIVT